VVVASILIRRSVVLGGDTAPSEFGREESAARGEVIIATICEPGYWDLEGLGESFAFEEFERRSSTDAGFKCRINGIVSTSSESSDQHTEFTFDITARRSAKAARLEEISSASACEEMQGLALRPFPHLDSTRILGSGTVVCYDTQLDSWTIDQVWFVDSSWVVNAHLFISFEDSIEGEVQAVLDEFFWDELLPQLDSFDFSG
jgi:hypothetical protein